VLIHRQHIYKIPLKSQSLKINREKVLKGKTHNHTQRPGS